MLQDHTQNSHNKLKAKAKLYLSAGRYEVAEKTLQEAIRVALSEDRNKQAAELCNLLGFLYHRQSQFSKAMQAFEQAYEHDPHFMEARINHAITLCDLGEYKQPKRILSEGKSHIDKHYNLSYLTLQKLAIKHQALGHDYLTCNMEHHALSEYQKALQLYKDQPALRLKIAEVLIHLGNFQEATHHLEKLTLVPQLQEQAYALLGIIAAQTGNYTDKNAYHQKITQPKTKLLKAYQKLSQQNALAQSPTTAQTPPPASFAPSDLPPFDL